MNNLVKYWVGISPLRRGFLSVGLAVTLPIVIMVVIVAGIAEVWKMIQNLEV